MNLPFLPICLSISSPFVTYDLVASIIIISSSPASYEARQLFALKKFSQCKDVRTCHVMWSQWSMLYKKYSLAIHGKRGALKHFTKNKIAFGKRVILSTSCVCVQGARVQPGASSGRTNLQHHKRHPPTCGQQVLAHFLHLSRCDNLSLIYLFTFPKYPTTYRSK